MKECKKCGIVSENDQNAHEIGCEVVQDFYVGVALENCHTDELRHHERHIVLLQAIIRAMSALITAEED